MLPKKYRSLRSRNYKNYAQDVSNFTGIAYSSCKRLCDPNKDINECDYTNNVIKVSNDVLNGFDIKNYNKGNQYDSTKETPYRRHSSNNLNKPSKTNNTTVSDVTYATPTSSIKPYTSQNNNKSGECSECKDPSEGSVNRYPPDYLSLNNIKKGGKSSNQKDCNCYELVGDSSNNSTNNNNNSNNKKCDNKILYSNDIDIKPHILKGFDNKYYHHDKETNHLTEVDFNKFKGPQKTSKEVGDFLKNYDITESQLTNIYHPTQATEPPTGIEDSNNNNNLNNINTLNVVEEESIEEEAVPFCKPLPTVGLTNNLNSLNNNIVKDLNNNAINNKSGTEDPNNSLYLILYIVTGVLFLILCIVMAIYFNKRKDKRKDKSKVKTKINTGKNNNDNNTNNLIKI